MADPRGIVAAGHPLTAEAGARVLRAGGNAVDAALGALLVSWVCEPLLTGPGAGGYLLVAGGDDEPTLLDFFVAAPGDGADPDDRAPLLPVDVSFVDAH
jgi:gamma-glutamyltranspeptidase / glutathione hydrolase